MNEKKLTIKPIPLKKPLVAPSMALNPPDAIVFIAGKIDETISW
jgi:hypothetical protein